MLIASPICLLLLQQFKEVLLSPLEMVMRLHVDSELTRSPFSKDSKCNFDPKLYGNGRGTNILQIMVSVQSVLDIILGAMLPLATPALDVLQYTIVIE